MGLAPAYLAICYVRNSLVPGGQLALRSVLVM